MQNFEQQLQQALNECQRLKQENQQLKQILKSHNIDYRPQDSQTISMKEQVKKEKILERIQISKIFLEAGTMFLLFAGNLVMVERGIHLLVNLSGIQTFAINLK